MNVADYSHDPKTFLQTPDHLKRPREIKRTLLIIHPHLPLAPAHDVHSLPLPHYTGSISPVLSQASCFETWTVPRRGRRLVNAPAPRAPGDVRWQIPILNTHAGEHCAPAPGWRRGARGRGGRGRRGRGQCEPWRGTAAANDGVTLDWSLERRRKNIKPRDAEE